MTREIVLVGDRTASGGVVISGSKWDTIDGRSIARLGDDVDCPEKYPDGRPHGVNRIAEGDASMLVDGRAVALAGHRSECGCVLLAGHNGAVG